MHANCCLLYHVSILKNKHLCYHSLFIHSYLWRRLNEIISFLSINLYTLVFPTILEAANSGLFAYYFIPYQKWPFNATLRQSLIPYFIPNEISPNWKNHKSTFEWFHSTLNSFIELIPMRRISFHYHWFNSLTNYSTRMVRNTRNHHHHFYYSLC